MTRTRRAGRGSNQYESRGTGSSSARGRASAADLRRALESEAAAWAFGASDVDEDGHWTKLARLSRTVDEQLRLAGHPDPSVRATLAASKHATPELLNVLVGDVAGLVADAALRNDGVPVSTLTRVAEKGGKEQRRAALRSERVPVEDLVRFVADDDVNDVVLSNVRCPSEVLAYVAREYHSTYGSEHDERLSAALANPSCPVEVLREVAGDQPGSVCRNPNCPPETIVDLHDDGWTSSADITSSIARHPNTTPEVLKFIAEEYALQHGYWYQAKTAVEHPALPPETLRRFASFHTSPAPIGENLRRAALANPACTAEIVSSRTRDISPRVRNDALRHDLCTSSDLRHAAAWDQNASVRMTALRRIDDVEFLTSRLVPDWNNEAEIRKRIDRLTTYQASR